MGKGYWGFPFKKQSFAERPWWVRVLLVVLLIVVLLPVLLAGLLSTEALSRWAFEQADARLQALSLDFESGHFWRGWNFAHVSWQSQALNVDIERLELEWKPSCLISRGLCIQRLYSHRVTVILPETEQADQAPIELPDIRLPLSLELGQVTLDELSLDGESTLLSELYLQTHTRGSRIIVSEFSGRGPELHWNLQGDVLTQGKWPLNLTGHLQLPPVDQQEWSLEIVAGGSLEKILLSVTSKGYLDGSLQGQLAPFEPGIPASAKWQGDAFLPYRDLPETLTLDDWTLDASGDFDRGFAVQGHSLLPLATDHSMDQTVPVELFLSGRLTLSEASDVQVQLSVGNAAKTPGKSERTALLSGDVSWKDQLDLDARLNLQSFPWQRIYALDTGGVELQTLDAGIRWTNGQLKSDLAAKLKGVSRRVTGQVSTSPVVALDAHVAGNAQALHIHPLKLSIESGTAEGELFLGFDSGIEWDGQLRLQDLNPGVLVKELPGSVSGLLSSQGQWQGDNLTLDSEWDIDGHLRNDPLLLQGRLSKSAATWRLRNLKLRQGENRLSGSGHWGQTVAGNFDVQLHRLQSLWFFGGSAPRGTLSGPVRLSGSARSPVLDLQLQGSGLGYDDWRIRALALQGSVGLDNRTQGKVSLTADDVRQGDVLLGDVQLALSGDRSGHQLTLDIHEGFADVSAQLSGSLNSAQGSDPDWQGVLSRSQVTLGQQNWQLQNRVNFNYQLDSQTLTMSGHCWRYDSASLCFNDQQSLMPDRKLDLAMQRFDLSSLNAWMPEDFSWEGLLDASLTLTQARGGTPVAEVMARTSSGVIRLTEAEKIDDERNVHDFPYQLIDLTARLEENIATTRLRIASEALGLLDINAKVMDPAGQQQLEGRYQLNDFKLDFLRPLIPQVSRLEGELNGQGNIGGVLREPDIGGQLRLSGGFLSGNNLPVSLENLTADILVEGQAARIRGQWVSGEQGKGQVNGEIRWAPLGGELRLSGQRLPATIAPYAQLYISPDLELSLRNSAVNISGKVAIPAGEVIVKELEKEAVQLSPDAVIVGREKPQDTVPLKVTARVRLDIGDQLHLNAFGLKGRLSGQLDVRENMTATGDLRLLNGTFNRLGQDLKLRRALLLFSGPVSKPYLSVEAVREVGDVVAGLRLTGRARNPESEVFSEPALSQQEALSYLILGRGIRTDEEADGEDSNLIAQAALSLGVAGTAPFTQKVAASLGLKDFDLETEGVGNATQVVASGSITDKLSLRYGVGVFDSSTEVGVRYDLSRRLYIEAISGFASSLDFFYRIDF
ncbi:translocation/assembly module TamB [Aestuariicella sp. G3-2]|uniref:translocation/assembly module TamB domain-containing protein n=1 Tax=Pseudomaricurvus albidus TaxID=2842452 RepID=UPI001C0D975A|nr:translocation/assembly module TamB domain-containing protein [Aestuariicella albida]MBU3069324.1 translocation/assembly module TamB [Aestuariicella albida]